MDFVVLAIICIVNAVTSNSESIPMITDSYNYTEEISSLNHTVDSRLNNQSVSESVCKILKWQYRPQTSVIFGGSNVDPGGFPHMGAVGWRSKNASHWVFKCGGSLINADFVLTAAHCSWLSLRSHYDVVQNEPEVVRFGVENIVDSESNKYGGPTDKIIKRIIKHPNYKPPKRYYDIALIELRDKFSSFSEHLHPACLWTKPITFDYSEFKLSGWGLTEHGSPAHHLQFAKVDILDTKKCDSLLARHRGRNWQGFVDHQLCAGNLSGKVDSCQGDSGGPLQEQIPFTSLYYIVGVTSFGIGCGIENRPGIYTKVYSFLEWIELHVWKDFKESDFISSFIVFEDTDETAYYDEYDQV